MASDLDNINARISAIYAELANISRSKPDYSKDGQSIQWASNRRELMDELKSLLAQRDVAAGPWNADTRVIG